MREIKFRAWANGKMGYCPMQTYFAGYGCMFDWFEKPDAFMQYTGLKDKNGVEIYEGDIVTHRIYSPTLVESLSDFFQYMLPDIEKWGWHGDGEDLGFEVIGNIHENPELLEDK